MSTKQIEALKLALEALESVKHKIDNYQVNVCDDVDEAITAIREALAEQPEPSAYWHSEFLKYNTTSDHRMMENAQGDLERIKLVQTGVGIGKPNGCQCPACKVTPHASDCAVHNEPAYPKNACDCGAQPEQEPVAYSYTSRITGAQGFSHHPMPRFIDSESWDIKPLYTSPQPSKPLTDEEIWDEVKAADLDWQTGWSLDEDAANRYIIFARAIEAKHGIKENT